MLLPVRKLGVYQQLGGDRTRTANPNGPRDIPYHVVPCLEIKSEGKNEGRVDIFNYVTRLPKKLVCMMGPVFLNVNEYLPINGK